MKKILLLLVLLLLSGCVNRDFDDIPYVKIEKIVSKTLNSNKTYQGYIKKGQDVDLSFNISGIIRHRYVIEGDFVKKGKLLAELDNEEYNFNIERANFALNDAKVKSERAKSYYDRISKLYDAGGISYNDWEEAKTNLQSNINQIEILKDALLIAKKQKNYTKIYAPYDGYVIKAYKDPYQYAKAGEPVFYFQGEKDFEARIFVPQTDVRVLKEKDEVEIIVDAFPDKKYRGFIKSKINSSLNRGSYEIKILILNNDKEILDGMSVSVSALNKSIEKEILIPINSILKEEDETFVFVLKKEDGKTGIAEKRKIETGKIIKGFIEVKEGLKEGEFIVTDGINRIMEGSKANYL